MNYQDLVNSNKIRICPISAMWLLLTLLLSILLLASCTTPKSVNRSFTKPLEKTTSYETKDNNEVSNSEKDDEFNRLLKEAKSKDKSNKNNEGKNKKALPKSSNDNLDKADAVEIDKDNNKDNIAIPKFDDLLNSLNKEVENIRTDVTTLKNDNVEIKYSLEEIKEALRVINKNDSRKSVVGDMNMETNLNQNPNTIPNDKKVKEERPIYTEQDKLSANKSKPKMSILSNEAVKESKNESNNGKKVKEKTITSDQNNSNKKNKEISNKDINNKIVNKNENNQNLPVDSKLSLALNNIKSKNYKQAINELIDILNSTNNESLKGETQYYLAESQLGLKDYDKAITSFKNVIKSPKQDLYDDSQFKIADTYFKKGNKDVAKVEYQNLVKKYPNSQYLPIARKMLQQL